MMGDESFTTRIGPARRSPIDRDATHLLSDDLLSDDGRSGERLPVCDGVTDESNLEPRKSGGCIAVIESRTFLRECIYRSLQANFPLPVVPYPSVSELNNQPRSTDLRLVVLSLFEVEREISNCTLKALLQSFPGIPVIVLGYKNDPELARTAICYGARGYIPFTMEFTIAVEVVRFVLAGGTYVPADWLDYPRVAATPPAAPGAITNRELAVVRGIQQGKSNKVIAYDMNMCESTVKVHVRNIMKKLKAKNRTDVAIKAQTALSPIFLQQSL